MRSMNNSALWIQTQTSQICPVPSPAIAVGAVLGIGENIVLWIQKYRTPEKSRRSSVDPSPGFPYEVVARRESGTFLYP